MAYSESDHPTGVLLLAVILSFVIASSLNVYPLSPTMATLRPMVMIMVLIFWLLFQPRYIGVFSAFTIGLIADLLLDTRLGQQAFAAVVVALVIKISSIYIRHTIIITYIVVLEFPAMWNFSLCRQVFTKFRKFFILK